MWPEKDKEVQFPQYIATLLASGGAFAMGTIYGFSSPAYRLLVIDESDVTNENQVVATEMQFDWIASSMTLGAAFACVPAGLLVNLIGRRYTLLVLIFPIFIGWMLIITAINVNSMYAGRIFQGLSVGGYCVAIPVYNSEIAQKEIRGKLGSFFQMMINIGILFVFGHGSILKLPIFGVACLCVSLFIMAGGLWIPETPVFLVKGKRYEKAERALRWLRGGGFNAKLKVDDLKREMEQLKENSMGLLDSFKRRSTIHGLLIMLGLMVTLQMTGVNIIIFYTAEIFMAANTGLDPGTATIVVGAAQVCATFTTSLVVDKFGRRILLTVSVFFMGCSTTLIAVYFHLHSANDYETDGLGWLPVFGMSLFVVMYSLGIGTVAWIMIGELFAPDIRVTAVSLGTTIFFLLAFVVSMSFSAMYKAIGIDGTFWFYTAFNVVGVIFIILFVPETKGMALEDVEKLLSGNKILMFK